MRRRAFLAMSSAILLTPHGSVQGAAKEEFRPLFNGKDLSGWIPVDCKDGTWKVESGNLIVEKAEGGWLRTDREYKDFTLKLEFNLTPGGNSGVFLRAPLQGNGAFEGLEIQILDHFHEMYQKPGAAIKPEQYTGSIYDLFPGRDPKAIKPAGTWNTYEITHHGDHVKVVLNGVVMNDVNLEEKRDRIAEHPGIGRKEGYIGLQSHGSKVEFRNILIREM